MPQRVSVSIEFVPVATVKVPAYRLDLE